nr:hypothetical protein [Tanacetum cinerariifolium]
PTAVRIVPQVLLQCRRNLLAWNVMTVTWVVGERSTRQRQAQMELGLVIRATPRLASLPRSFWSSNDGGETRCAAISRQDANATSQFDGPSTTQRVLELHSNLALDLPDMLSLQGKKAILCTGTDEHGLKVVILSGYSEPR